MVHGLILFLQCKMQRASPVKVKFVVVDVISHCVHDSKVNCQIVIVSVKNLNISLTQMVLVCCTVFNVSGVNMSIPNLLHKFSVARFSQLSYSQRGMARSHDFLHKCMS